MIKHNAPSLGYQLVEELPARHELQHDEDFGLGGQHLPKLHDVAVIMAWEFDVLMDSRGGGGGGGVSACM